MWEWDHKEGCVPNWCSQTVVLERTRRARRSNQSILKEINPEYSTGRTDAEAPILWPPDVKRCLTGKDPDAEKDWGQEEKWATEDEMVGRHYWLTGHEFEQTLGDREGQGSLACCSLWGHKELDMTYWLNNMSCQTKSLKAPCILHSLIAPPVGSSPGSGRSPREGNGTPLQYSCLENPMQRAAWQATVLRITMTRTWLKRFHTHYSSPLDVNKA